MRYIVLEHKAHLERIHKCHFIAAQGLEREKLNYE